MSKYIPPPPVRSTEPKTKIIIENGTIPNPPKAPECPSPREIIDDGVVPEKTRVFRGERPTTVKYRTTKVNLYGSRVITRGLCLLVGIIFGLLIGRFV